LYPRGRIPPANPAMAHQSGASRGWLRSCSGGSWRDALSCLAPAAAMVPTCPTCSQSNSSSASRLPGKTPGYALAVMSTTQSFMAICLCKHALGLPITQKYLQAKQADPVG
jgi:hypothetical protein